jgi:hypothetical protein
MQNYHFHKLVVRYQQLYSFTIIINLFQSNRDKDPRDNEISSTFTCTFQPFPDQFIHYIVIAILQMRNLRLIKAKLFGAHNL